MTNILIVIDPEEEVHTALARVKELAPTADINYKVDLYRNVQPILAKDASASSEAIRADIEAKRAWLYDLVRPFTELGYRIKTELIVVNRFYEDIIKSAKRFEADFIFKPLRQHSVLKRAFYTSTDWNLIRLCPTPVLFVSDEEVIHGKPVIAAVDIGDKDDAHQELNRIVLDRANLLARVLESSVHLVCAYEPAVVASGVAVGDPLAFEVIRGKYDVHFASAESLAEEFGIDREQVHLREGATETVLHEYAKKVGAGVTVIGTVARSGASGLFVGNTAEAVLERTETDIFVVKGTQFKAPV